MSHESLNVIITWYQYEVRIGYGVQNRATIGKSYVVTVLYNIYICFLSTDFTLRHCPRRRPRHPGDHYRHRYYSARRCSSCRSCDDPVDDDERRFRESVHIDVGNNFYSDEIYETLDEFPVRTTFGKMVDAITIPLVLPVKFANRSFSSCDSPLPNRGRTFASHSPPMIRYLVG